jgi:hypothetical protein
LWDNCATREIQYGRQVVIKIINSINLFRLALDARDRAEQKGSDAIVAIVMASAAAEAFINDVADTPTIEPRLNACVDALVQLEQSRASVTLKYLVASLCLSGSSFNKGSAPYQDFAMLIQLRNAIMHGKVTTMPGEIDKQGERIVDELGKRKIASGGSSGVHQSWFDKIQHPKVAQWACVSAHAVITSILDMASRLPGNHSEPLGGLRYAFQAGWVTERLFPRAAE